MKILYSLLFILLINTGHQLNAQCKASLQLTDDGKGGFAFQAAVVDTDSVFTSYWLVDSVVVDSNTMNTAYKFYTNGNHQVCFQFADTSGCVIDTCKIITVTDAEYHPLLDSVNDWYLQILIIGEDQIGPCSYPSGSTRFYTTDTATIDTSAYFTVVGSYSANYDSNFTNPCTFGYIREDTAARKVYFKDVNGHPEVLLYDFSMKVGEKVNLHYYYYDTSYYEAFILDSIVPVSINAGIRRAFFLHYIGTQNPPNRGLIAWLEGVGNLNQPFYLYIQNNNAAFECSYPYNAQPYLYSNSVTCFLHDQSVYSDSCTYSAASASGCLGCIVTDSCIYGYVGGAVLNIDAISSMMLSPNPSTGPVNIQMQIAQGSNFSINIWDIQGRQMGPAIPLGKLGTGGYNKQIDLSALPSGFYMVECKTDAGSLYKKLVIAK